MGHLEVEIDSTLSAVALGVSLICFAALSLGEASITFAHRERASSPGNQGVVGSGPLDRLGAASVSPTTALRLVRTVAFSASLVSGVAIVIAGLGAAWVTVAVVSLAVLAFLSLIDGAARMVAFRYGEIISLRIASVVRVLAWLLRPVLSVEAAMTHRRLKPHSERSSGVEGTIPFEISLPMESNGEALDEHEVRMIRGVVRLDKTVAREIMVPRVDMVAAEVSTTVAELAKRFVEGRHSRIPIYSGDLDHIEGIAYARDVLDEMLRGQGAPSTRAETVIRPALFIPESKTLEELLNEFQQRRMHMAIVIDEYGGVSGLVTIEDLLEEIVGEIQDEFDVGETEIEPFGDREFLMDARVSIDQLNELLDVSVEAEGFDTLGGFIYHRLGKIPSPGDSVEYDGLRIEVVSTAGRRLKRLRVTLTRSLGRDSAAG